jgi:hypothetical protein
MRHSIKIGQFGPSLLSEQAYRIKQIDLSTKLLPSCRYRIIRTEVAAMLAQFCHPIYKKSHSITHDESDTEDN